VVICLERGASDLHMVQLMPLQAATPSSLASLKSRTVLPFWCRLIQVVPEKRPLKGFVCSIAWWWYLWRLQIYLCEQLVEGWEAKQRRLKSQVKCH